MIKIESHRSTSTGLNTNSTGIPTLYDPVSYTHLTLPTTVDV